MLPEGLIIAIIVRDAETIAEPIPGSESMELKAVTLSKNNKWNGKAIRDLDISRQTFIVMVKRDDKKIVPRGSTILQEGDSVYMYKKA